MPLCPSGKTAQMTTPFLSRRTYFRAPNALLILLAVFFLVPFAFRGARMSLGTNENSVKDWLPDDFRETKELAWFSQYFYGERFILVTWDGCSEDSQRLSTLTAKLNRESARGRLEQEEQLKRRFGDYERVQKLAGELGLLLPSNQHYDWGGMREIWFTSFSGGWYYLTPDGSLYRWNGRDDSVGGLVRSVQRLVYGPHVEGKFITAVGNVRPGVDDDDDDDPGAVNEYYNDPAMLTVPLFATVQSGPDVVEKLSQEGGPFYPVDLTASELKPKIARRRAMNQLTGSLFASAIPSDFDWSPEAFVRAYPTDQRAALPAEIKPEIATALASIIDLRHAGSLQNLQDASAAEQTDVWYELFDRVGISPPPRQTALLVTLTEVGQDNLPFVAGRGILGGPQGRLYQLAAQAGLSPPPTPVMLPPPLNRLVSESPAPGPSLHVGGPPIDNVSIDEEGTITLVRLVGYCGALGLFLSYACFRSIKITIMIFFVGVFAAATSLSFVWWSGAGIDAILMSMPSLVYVLGLSSAIHIVNYYREEVQTGGVVGAPGRALAHGWGPCTLASVTTAIGLMSLYTSNIIPIRKFGLYSAIGVLATLALLFAYLPAALEIFVPSFAQKRKAAREAKAAAKSTSQAGDATANLGTSKALADHWEMFGRWVVNHHRLVTVCCLVFFVLAALGLPKIKTSVQLLKLFGPDSRIIRDYAWLEENFAKLVPMELVLRVPPEMQAERLAAVGETTNQPSNNIASTESDSLHHPLTLLERLEAVGRIERTLQRAFGEQGLQVTGNTMSASSMAPPTPPPANGPDPVRSGFNQKLSTQLQDLIDADLLAIEAGGPLEGSELWRISLRVGALSDVNYGHFVDQLRQAVEPVLAAYKYRDLLLDAHHEKGSDKQNQSVLVLSEQNPKRLGQQELVLPELEGATPFAAASEVLGRRLDQQAIFAATLRELLANERFHQVQWGNPQAEQFAAALQSPKFAKFLDSLAAVIALPGTSDEDLAFLRSKVAVVVDARDVQFDRSTTEIVDHVPVVNESGPLQVIYTGVIPVVYKAQNTLLSSLVDSIAWAFVLIGGVMIVLLNPGRPLWGMLRPQALLFGVGAGAVAMIPNVFPVVMIFGSMGHLGTLVDIGTMMTASVAMGVAVDDTIHFLSWLRRGLDSGLERHEALIQTYRRVGPAMTQTTLVGGLGLFVFALSTFTPTQRFGTLMLVLLAAALVGDLIFLPALLAGPLGKLFRPRPHAHSADPQDKPTPSSSQQTQLPADLMAEAPASAAGQKSPQLKPPDQVNSPPNPKMLRGDHSHPHSSHHPDSQ
ncbi:efflux RND transporter permease subunit [Planctomycetaceae bacterium SH139]